MVRKVVLRRAGGSLRVTLPAPFTERLRLRDGDTVFAAETELGILITPFDDQVARFLERHDHLARALRGLRR